MTAEDIRKLLRKLYPAPAFSVLEEVGDSTGFSTRRHIDAIVMGLWPSRGLDLSGFEIKVSLGDWRKELANPEKAEAIQKYCDYWWVVAPKDVIPLETVPTNWGLMEATQRGLRAKKAAPALKATPINRHFLAAILKRTADWAQQLALDDKRYQEGYVRGMEQGKSLFKDVEWEHKSLLEAVEEFEQASGVIIKDGWNASNIGDAVRLVLSGKHLDRMKELRRLEEFMAANLESIRKQINAPLIEEKPR